MTVSIGRIVHVEYPGVFDGVKPGIVTAVWGYDSVDVTVFGVGNARGHGTREYMGVKFYHERPEADLQYATAYYPPRVQDAPKPEEPPQNQLVDPDKPIKLSGSVVGRILEIAEENRGG